MHTGYLIVTMIAIAIDGFSGVSIGLAAAAGLTVFFVCAIYTHVLANDISGQFAFAGSVLALNSATFVLTLVTHPAVV
jgi:hypothetical protein